MKAKNIYLISAGILNVSTSFIHILAGQSSLVDPLIVSDLNLQLKTEWVAVWHMVTIMLLASSWILLNQGFVATPTRSPLVLAIGYLYIFFASDFIVVSLAYGMFAPQWILLLPIGLLAILGSRQKYKSP